VPGHERSGTVDAVGEGVDPALVGRRTVAEGFHNCQSCDRCREGATTLCQRGYEETGFTRPGALADTLVVPARLLHPLADDTDLRAAALLEPAAVSATAVLSGSPQPGDRVAVVGAGTHGLIALQLLAASSPSELLMVDHNLRRAEQALAMGATDATSPDEARSRGGFDLVIETATAPTTARDACLLARRGGRVVLAGLHEPGTLGIDPIHLAVNQLTLTSVFGAPSAAWTRAVRALATGVLDLLPLITHELPLTAFGEAMDLLAEDTGDVGKILVMP
jgi:threonine dehydrogenase-like Zn-dependent dehydrogenase